MERIQLWWENLQAFWQSMSDFEQGFYLALLLAGALFLVILIVCALFRLMFRKPQLPGITLEQPDGNVMISRGAIASLVERLEDKFRCFEVVKVSLTQERNGTTLGVTLDFDPAQNELPEQIKQFKTRVFIELKSVFGIDSITAVNLAMHKSFSREDEISDRAAAAKVQDLPNDTMLSGF